MQIVSVSRFMPERVVRAEDLPTAAAELEQNDFYKAPRERRFASPEYSTAQLGIEALKKLLLQTGDSPKSIQLLLYSTMMTDSLTVGVGPAIVHGCGLAGAPAIEINTGCTSYLSMLHLARGLIESGRFEAIAIVTITNFVSRLAEYQRSPKSWPLGDGASATLVVKGAPSILTSVEKTLGENYGLLELIGRTPDGARKDFWAAEHGPLEVELSHVETVKRNGAMLVVDAVKQVIRDAQLTPDDIQLLVTHQPNNGLLRKWREGIGIQEPRAFDTYQQYGNVFQSSIPVTLSEALERSLLRKGDLLAMGTFSNGGDVVAAMTVRWS